MPRTPAAPSCNATPEQIRAITELILAVDHLSKTDRVYDSPESRRRRLGYMMRRALETGLSHEQVIEVIW